MPESPFAKSIPLFEDSEPDCLLERGPFDGRDKFFVVFDSGLDGLLSIYEGSEPHCLFDEPTSLFDKPKYNINKPTDNMCLNDTSCLLNKFYFYFRYVSGDRSMRSQRPLGSGFSNYGSCEAPPSLLTPCLLKTAEKNAWGSVQVPPTVAPKHTDIRSGFSRADLSTEKLPQVSHPGKAGLNGVETLMMLGITLLWFFMIYRIFRSTVGAQVVWKRKLVIE